MEAYIAEPLAAKYIALLGRQKYVGIHTAPAADRPGLVHITATYDAKAKGSGRGPANFRVCDIQAAHRFVNRANAGKEQEPEEFDRLLDIDTPARVQEAPTVQVPEETRRAIGLACHAAVKTDVRAKRANLQGVHVTVGNVCTIVQATDGHRLVECRVPNPSNAIYKTLLPLDVARSIAKGKGPLDLPLIDPPSPFPDAVFEAYIPEKRSNPVKVSIADLQVALTSISRMYAERIKPCRLTVKDGRIVLQSEKAEYGDNETSVRAETGEANCAIGVNAAYLLDVCRAVKAAKGKTLILSITEPLKPIAWVCPEIPCVIGVLMPLRLEW